MYTVYVIKDNKGNFYKGFTNNIDRRMKEHRSGKTKTTKKMDNIKIVYSENAANRQDARTREKYLKSAAGRRYLKSIGIMQS